ncbi:hypothetical protein CHX27_07515 [Flavobacterium aurantiibacter]|uniref:Uncharacterized protein n=1 Tax=Flavobacterium aurantiibacter TaxID=2023067 RepID=A0A255ZSM2_9FLAO|nr:hypothetical protein CHX27_07515 [Flavobacterium aurantiibacter]
MRNSRKVEKCIINKKTAFKERFFYGLIFAVAIVAKILLLRSFAKEQKIAAESATARRRSVF